MSSQRLRSCRFREACCPLAITLIRVLISVSVLVEKAHFCGSEGLKDLINSRSTLGVAGGSVQFDLIFSSLVPFFQTDESVTHEEVATAISDAINPVLSKLSEMMDAQRAGSAGGTAVPSSSGSTGFQNPIPGPSFPSPDHPSLEVPAEEQEEEDDDGDLVDIHHPAPIGGEMVFLPKLPEDDSWTTMSAADRALYKAEIAQFMVPVEGESDAHTRIRIRIGEASQVMNCVENIFDAIDGAVVTTKKGKKVNLPASLLWIHRINAKTICQLMIAKRVGWDVLKKFESQLSSGRERKMAKAIEASGKNKTAKKRSASTSSAGPLRAKPRYEERSNDLKDRASCACFSCGSLGHYAQNCKKKPRSASSSGSLK